MRDREQKRSERKERVGGRASKREKKLPGGYEIERRKLSVKRRKGKLDARGRSKLELNAARYFYLRASTSSSGLRCTHPIATQLYMCRHGLQRRARKKKKATTRGREDISMS